MGAAYILRPGVNTLNEPYARQPASRFRFEEILYEKKDGVARVTLNRPEVYNAFSAQTLREMVEAFRDASWDDPWRSWS